MRAAVTHGVGEPFVIEEIDIGEPFGYEVLVDIKASGLCHSDLYVAERGLGVSMPIVLGHEIAGVVTAVGELVTEFTVGDRVAACLEPSCGRCSRCRTGRVHQCLNPQAMYRRDDQPPRLTRHGAAVAQFWGLSGFAEQALTHENQLVAIPDEIADDRACLLGCAVVTGAGAVINTAGVRVGDTVAVFGCGGVGLNTVQAARLSGARRIIAVDLQAEKLDLALRFGATDVVDPAAGDTVEQIRRLTDGAGVDHAFEVIGLTQTVRQAVRCLATGGGAYLIGLHKPGNVADVELDGDLMVHQSKLQGVHMGSVNLKRDIPLYADYYLQGRFNLDDLVSQTITLDQINDAYAELATGKVARSVIVF